ncbi:MAG: hypothetical protein E6Q98_10625 [Rhodospirillaceae bacterium]|nr:MAG: hypothetical protein E6Q98_10625 [Rhodospirillaceae bacterium]
MPAACYDMAHWGQGSAARGMKNADRINFYGQQETTHPPAASAQASKPTAETRADDTSVETALRDTALLRAQLTSILSQPLDVDSEKRELQRLLRDIDTARQGQSDASSDKGNRQRRLTERRRWRFAQLGLLAAFLVALISATALWWVYRQAESMLGRPLTPAILFTATAEDLRVTFRPEAGAADIGDLLRSLQLRVVDGPASDGSYVLRPERGGDSVKAANALRDRRTLVHSVVAAD